MGLSIKDILLLDYFDGKPAHHKVPPYKERASTGVMRMTASESSLMTAGSA